MAVPGPHCCKQAFSSCSEHDLLFTGCVGFSSQSMDSKARTSVVVGHWLSCPAAPGIFLEQGSNLRPLDWQEGFYLLDYPGSLMSCFSLVTLDNPTNGKRDGTDEYIKNT